MLILIQLNIETTVKEDTVTRPGFPEKVSQYLAVRK